MRVAYGPAVSSTPTSKRKGNGRTDVCAQRAHVYFAIPRTLGGQDDYGLANSKARRNVRLLGAEWVSAEPTHDYAKYLASGRPAARFPAEQERWLDWYRMPLRGRTTNEIAVLLREKGVEDGPYWGAGRVGESAGSGPALLASKRSAPLREAVKEVVREKFVGELLRDMFGDAFWQELENYPDENLSTWTGTQAQWLLLCGRCPGFRAAYALIENRFFEADSACDADGLALWGPRKDKIERWIAFQLGEEHKAAPERGHFPRHATTLQRYPLDRPEGKDVVGERGPIPWTNYFSHESEARIDSAAAEFVAWEAFDACI